MAKMEADVVVIGAGIIGLLTARALLQRKLSVILVERAQLYAGATGAGEGLGTEWKGIEEKETRGVRG